MEGTSWTWGGVVMGRMQVARVVWQGARQWKLVAGVLVLALAVAFARRAAGAGERLITSFGSSPAVATSVSGRTVVAWVGPDGSGGESVWAQRFAGDMALAPPMLVSDDARDAVADPVVAADARGNFVVVWQS